MLQSITLAALLGSLLPFSAAANLQNWEGSHIDVAANNRAIDWWYTQVVSQTPARNGIPPSIEVVLKHGNTFQFGSSNTPLYPVEVNGFEQNGAEFKKTIIFDTSTVVPSAGGATIGTWAKNSKASVSKTPFSNTTVSNTGDTAIFHASADKKIFKITFNMADLKGTVEIKAQSSFRTGCGGTSPSDSPYFDKLVEGKSLTNAENILYKETGWRITIPSGSAMVDLTLDGKPIKFNGAGYKDSNWGPNAMNDFVKSWYVLIAQVGPWGFVTFSGTPTTGTNYINSAHLSYKGPRVSSGVTAPTAFDVTFVVAHNKNVTFKATNIAENPSVSVYHRWVAKYEGGATGEKHTGYSITEWMNAGKVLHWPTIG